MLVNETTNSLDSIVFTTVAVARATDKAAAAVRNDSELWQYLVSIRTT